MLTIKDFMKIFVYTLVILICIKLSLYDHPFTYKLHQYNRAKALKQGMKNPYAFQRLKDMAETIPQNLYMITGNFMGYFKKILQRPAR